MYAARIARLAARNAIAALTLVALVASAANTFAQTRENGAAGSPPAPVGSDTVAIERELYAHYPWLDALSNRTAVTDIFTRRIAWHHEFKAAIAARDQLPDPARTVVSHDRLLRRKARAPFERRRHRAIDALSALPRSQLIDIADLLAADFVSAGATEPERAARAAMRAHILRHQGYVVLDLRASRPRLFVYLHRNWLRLRDRRIHPNAFWERVTPLFLELQAEYDRAYARAGRAALGQLVAADPWLVGAHLRSIVAGQRQRDTERRLREQSSGHEVRALRSVRHHRAQVARTMRTEVVAAVAPAVVAVRLFAVQGVTDVFLAVFPFGKTAQLVRAGAHARKIRQADKLAKKVSAELTGALSGEQILFTRAVARLSRRDMRALKRLHKQIPDPEILTRLAVRASKGDVNLRWLSRLLSRKVIDVHTVDHFMRFDAYPTWRQLQAVIENTIHGPARNSVMSKLTGFVGERSGARFLQSADVARKLGAHKPLKLVRGHRSLDIMAHTDDNKLLVFAEVKNWSAATWSKPSQHKRLFRQLESHDKAIERAVEGLGKRPVDARTAKLLMVTEKGFMSMPPNPRAEFRIALKQTGWRLEPIPQARVENVGDFIDRLRKGS